jgi:hypothetical protein
MIASRDVEISEFEPCLGPNVFANWLIVFGKNVSVSIERLACSRGRYRRSED